MQIHIAEYKNIIFDLRGEIDILKHKLIDRNSNAMNEIMEQDDESLVNNYVGQKKTNVNCSCNCHRAEDEEDTRKI